MLWLLFTKKIAEALGAEAKEIKIRLQDEDPDDKYYYVDFQFYKKWSQENFDKLHDVFGFNAEFNPGDDYFYMFGTGDTPTKASENILASFEKQKAEMALIVNAEKPKGPMN